MKKNSVIKGVAAIGNEGIKKHFKTAEVWQPLFELVLNGFDAAAANVSVDLVQNGMDGIERVVVKDDGHGSDFNTLNDSFGSFNDSAKKAMDVYNGFLLSANLDALFDSFLISFTDDGELLVSNQITQPDRERLGLDVSMRLRWMAAPHAAYLEFHRHRLAAQEPEKMQKH